MGHVQVKFYTNQPQYAIPDNSYSVPANVGVDELNKLISSQLSSDINESFEFLIGGEFLRLSLDEHLQEKSLSSESVVEIQYVKREAAPEPGKSLLHNDWVSAVHSSDSLILTGSYDGVARVWNTSGELLLDTVKCAGHSGQPIKCVTWISDDETGGRKRFVTGSHDETLLTWTWNRRENELDCVTACRGHGRSVDCVAVSPDGSQFCSGSWDTMLKLWSTAPVTSEETDEEPGERPHKRKRGHENKLVTRVPLMTLSGHSEGISSVAWIDETSLCSASWDHSIRLWDLQQAATISTFMGSKAFFGVSYSSLCKQLIASSADRHIRLYDTRSTSGTDISCTFSSHTAWVSCVAWSPTHSHHFISGSYDQLVKLWDTRCPKGPLYDMSGHNDKVLAVDWSMPRFILSGAADNDLKIFRSADISVNGCEQ